MSKLVPTMLASAYAIFYPMVYGLMIYADASMWLRLPAAGLYGLCVGHIVFYAMYGKTFSEAERRGRLI